MNWWAAWLICAAFLAGCADVNGLPTGDGWHERLEHAPLPATWIQLPRGSLGAACGQTVHWIRRGPNVERWETYACAIRDYTEGVCWIYAEFPRSQMAGYQVAHEEEHCRGRDHVRN